jgi:DHA2 family multidrug resistance protein
MMFVFGILLLASLVMMPLFLQTLMGYTAELAGLAISAGAFVVLFEMPVIGRLTTRVPVRYIIAGGWLLLAASMAYSALRMQLSISFAAATVTRIAQVVGVGLLFVPITLAAYVGVPPEPASSTSCATSAAASAPRWSRPCWPGGPSSIRSISSRV